MFVSRTLCLLQHRGDGVSMFVGERCCREKAAEQRLRLVELSGIDLLSSSLEVPVEVGGRERR